MGPLPTQESADWALAVLLEAVDQAAKPTDQHASHTRTAEQPAQIGEHAAQAALLIVLAGSAPRLLLQPAEHLGDLAPILIPATASSPKSATMDGVPRLISFSSYVLSGTHRHHAIRHQRAMSPEKTVGVYLCGSSAVTEPPS